MKGEMVTWIAAGAPLNRDDPLSDNWDNKLVAVVQAGVKSVAATSGAVTHDLSYGFTFYTTNSTADITLTVPDGTYPGQQTTIKCHTKDTNNVVVTPTTFHDGSTVTLDATNEVVTLVWMNSTDGWAIVSSTGTLA